MAAASSDPRKTRATVRRGPSSRTLGFAGRMSMAMVKPPRASSTSFGRMKTPAAEAEEHEPVAALAIGEYPGTPICGQTEQEGHDGFLAHIRGPEDEGGKEKKQVPVAAAPGSPERRGEGPIEEDDPDKGEKAEDEEGTQFVDPDDGEHHPGHDARPSRRTRCPEGGPARAKSRDGESRLTELPPWRCIRCSRQFPR